jgi:hypothetical protein
LRALCASTVAVVAIAVYADYATRRAPRIGAEPITPFAWVEPWFAAPVVTLTDTEILYRGEVIATVESQRDRDGPSWGLHALEPYLRAEADDLDPASPHARRRSAHTAICTAAQLVRVDRRILCAGRFLVVELDTQLDREIVGKLVMTAEHLGFSVVLTFRRES